MSVANTPKGFRIAVASAGIKYPGRSDMMLIVSDTPATFAGVYTTNKVCAANVTLNRKKARLGKASAVVVNSGNANACTGKQGMADTIETALLVAEGLGLKEQHVQVNSTGVIGVPMPMDRIKRGVKMLLEGLGKYGPMDAAKSIMTTDKFPKRLRKSMTFGGKRGSIVGIAKGAGMIEPNMATMLCYIITDFAVDGATLRAVFNEAVELSFNRITVDGDMSTSDSAMIFANGAAGNSPLKAGSADYKRFKKAITEMMYELAVMIVRDGEGATRLVEVRVSGAASDTDALGAAKKIANSLLVKTAIYGGDPNWGRILAVVGRSGIYFKEDKVDISLGRVKIVKGGLDNKKTSQAEKELDKPEVSIHVALNVGKHEAKVLTCDLTEEYIKINAEYTT